MENHGLYQTREVMTMHNKNGMETLIGGSSALNFTSMPEKNPRQSPQTKQRYSVAYPTSSAKDDERVSVTGASQLETRPGGLQIKL